MSITLKVEDYCQNCPEFEPEKLVNCLKIENFPFDKDKDIFETIIRCRYSKRCKNMERHIKRMLSTANEVKEEDSK